MDSHNGVRCPGAQEKHDPHARWRVLGAVSMGAFLASLDSSIVNMSLPTLVRAFDAGFARVQWVVLAYMVTVVSLILPLGRFGDVFGKKNIYLAGFAVFTVGSALCGWGMGLSALIAFRVIQGVGASMIMALGFAIVTEAFPAQERGRAIGILSALCAAAIALGPVLGGVCMEALSWPWIFRLNVPIGILGCAMVKAVVPEDVPIKGEALGIPGAVSLAATLVLLFTGLTWGQAHGFAFLAALTVGAGFSFAVFITCEARSAHPLIDVTLFSDRRFTINLVTGFIAFVAYAGMVLLLPFYLEEVAGYSTRKAGLLMAVVPVSLGVVSPLAGVLSDRLGTRLVTTAGLCVSLGAYFAASFLDGGTSMPGLVTRLAALGAGMGLFMSPNNSAIMGAVPGDRLGIASGLLTAARTLGQAMGAAVVGAFWVFRVSVHSGGARGSVLPPVDHYADICGFHDTFLGLFFLTAGGIVVSLWGHFPYRGASKALSGQSPLR
ncbi:DHA2 family efflux MFS transporter permease subunit [Desulfoluna butyratoxydans]|uniref:Drug resistance transporter emrb/qaca subfamily n=1 Tax=Desulfoluna butyratoxydans TaxID=231438 RepID=A0A4U8YJN3_9BACT|nr:DHA2 family efflux MFS transporter permease subunit [Desulfoluna butyratoxydans]VFQ43269.1 drug resistance transporter emrb/qaca subfamily [Desulfoluna butyratoxydans]